MLSMRGGRSLKPFAAIAASVVMAIAIPMTSAFADDHEGSHSKAPKAPTAPKVLTTYAPSNAAACLLDKGNLTAALATDKFEDMQERQAEKLDNEATEAAQAVAEKANDAAEKATLATIRAMIEKDCEPVPTTPPNPNCASLKTTLTNAIAADKAADPAKPKESPEVKGQPEVKSQTADPDAAKDAAVKAAQKAFEQACGDMEKD